MTERLDYFSATLTIAMSLLYAILRTLHLQTPLASSRLLFPSVAGIACLVLGHLTYLLTFPTGSFPYGYHTKFALCLALAHNALWLAWSASFVVRLPTLKLGKNTVALPRPYSPRDPLDRPMPRDAFTPGILVVLTTLAMSLELFDFAPFFRLLDAHALWHAATIPLAMGWWSFLCSDAIELEGAQLQARGVSSGAGNEKMPLSGGGAAPPSQGNGPSTPTVSSFTQLASNAMPSRAKSPGRSPGRSPRGAGPHPE